MNLSAIILTKNEEDIIEDCLQSVSFADEVVVIDDNSTDKTREIAEKNGARVFVHPMENFAQQRNFGLSKAKNEWVLFLDADERISPELQEEIVSVVRSPQ